MTDQIDDLLGGGWASLIQNQSEQEEYAYEVALKNYNDAKAVVDGISAEAFAVLYEKCVEPPTWRVDELGTINAVGYGIFREGQKSIHDYIKSCRKLVEMGPPEPPQTQQEETTNDT